MSVLLEKLKSAARTRSQVTPGDRLAEGSLLAQALRRAQAQRDAARGPDGIVAEAEATLPEAAPKPGLVFDSPPVGSRHGLAALLLAIAILVAAIAVWYTAPPGYEEHPQPGLKLERNLKTGG